MEKKLYVALVFQFFERNVWYKYLKINEWHILLNMKQDQTYGFLYGLCLQKKTCVFSFMRHIDIDSWVAYVAM